MGFEIRDLSVLAYANGFTMWHYKTSSTLETVMVPGYFAETDDMMHPGDLIYISAADGVAARYVDAQHVLRPTL
jgi:hypothetical protein